MTPNSFVEFHYRMIFLMFLKNRRINSEILYRMAYIMCLEMIEKYYLPHIPLPGISPVCVLLWLKSTGFSELERWLSG